VYPNPFTHETNISFYLEESSTVSLVIFNTNGEKVASLINHQEKARGLHRIIWDGRDEKGDKLAKGLYIYRLNTGTEFSGRIVLTR
jgi:flagellar hook assembly protein FlgD